MSASSPKLIQGGMGVGVSNWRLAKAVSSVGQLGVVSGTALDTVLIRRLQSGENVEDILRALKSFPSQVVATRFLEKFGARKSESAAFPTLPMPGANLARERQEALVLGNFIEVFLAKEGHDNPVGINYLEKVQLTTLPSLYGALLGGVDYVLMGAGIPWQIPDVLDHLTKHEACSMTLDVAAAGQNHFQTSFHPKEIIAVSLPSMNRPKFFPIISSVTLAMALIKKTQKRVDGFIVEGPTAGGHNAPPRGELQLSEKGEPIYGDRDQVNLEKLKQLNIPFWLAGGFAGSEKLNSAMAQGASGIQVGTVFAFCNESGVRSDLKLEFLNNVLSDKAGVFTDSQASPTGFPFKVAQLPDSLSNTKIYNERPRRCDLGYLRQIYMRDDGSLGYRCAGEPVADYEKKGGHFADTLGRKCLCNALLSNIGLEQIQPNGYRELPLLTAGDDINCLKTFISKDNLSYSAHDVVAKIMGESA